MAKVQTLNMLDVFHHHPIQQWWHHIIMIQTNFAHKTKWEWWLIECTLASYWWKKKNLSSFFFIPALKINCCIILMPQYASDNSFQICKFEAWLRAYERKNTNQCIFMFKFNHLLLLNKLFWIGNQKCRRLNNKIWKQIFIIFFSQNYSELKIINVID